MDNKIARLALLAVAAGTGAGTAAASTITISQRIDLGSLLAAGQGSSGAFNINAFLANGGSQPISVTSGSITAYAFSDAALQSSQTSSGYYSTGSSTRQTGASPVYAIGYYYVPQTCYYSWGGSYSCGYMASYYYVAYYNNYYATDQYRQADLTNRMDDMTVDTLKLMIGSASTTAAVGTTANTTGAYGGSQSAGQSGDYYSGYTYYSTRSRSASEVHSGALNLAMTLNQSAFDDLGADGILGFSFAQLIGQANLGWIQLDATVEETEVPEPGTLGVLALGLAGLGVARKARDRRKNRP